VEECGRDGKISERRSTEFIPVGDIAGDLLQAEVLVLAWTVEHDVACSDAEVGSDLRNADHSVLEVGEHFVGFASHRVTRDATGLRKKSSAPRFSASLIAFRSPRAKRSIGASAKVSVNSNSAIANPNIVKSILPPRRTAANSSARQGGAGTPACHSRDPKPVAESVRCESPMRRGNGTSSPRPSSNWQNGERRPRSIGRQAPVKPATSTISVGGMCACACSK
jgi:hypothetical protein